MKFIYSLLILLLSCSGSIQTPPLHRPCGQIFSPDAELKTETQVACERWSKATGCDVEVGEAGTSVKYTEGLYYIIGDQAIYFEPVEESLPACGYFSSTENAIYISRQAETLCPEDTIASVVTHEVGHKLAGRPGHAYDGVMIQVHKSDKEVNLITEASLLWVCLYQNCQEFIPETDWAAVQALHPELVRHTPDQ